jgi:2-isopropylmalate synthase
MSRFGTSATGTKSVMLVDCTLREGKQSIKKKLSVNEIILVAEQVLSLGVDQLEVGHAAISAREVNLLRQIRRIFPSISLMTHARAKREDILMASEARVDWVGIFISTNQHAAHRISNFSVQKVIDQVSESVVLAKENGLKVRFTIEDSSRTDMALMMHLFEIAVDLGADRICFADTLGILEPREVGAVVRKLTEKFSPVPLEVHLHNDRGWPWPIPWRRSTRVPDGYPPQSME